MEYTASELQYMQEHINDSRVPEIIIPNIVCGAVTCICVALRFLSRFMNRAGVGKDDYCIMLGLLTLCNDSTYVVSISLIKYSILLLYRRIFPGTTFRRFLISTTLIVMAWGLAAFFSSIFQCYPIESLWNSRIKGTCIDYRSIAFWIGIANVIIDIILLGLPLPILWKLQMSTRRKVLLFFTLGAGSSAFIASMVRLAYIKEALSTYDKTWDIVNLCNLSGVEMCTAIIACCVATYRPLVERGLIGISSILRGASSENCDASDRRGWVKIAVQREITIELGASTNSALFSGGDIEVAPLKDSNNFGVTTVSGPQSIITSQHKYGSSSHGLAI